MMYLNNYVTNLNRISLFTDFCLWHTWTDCWYLVGFLKTEETNNKKSTSLQLIKSRHGSETFLIFQIAFFRKSCHCRPYTYLLLFLNIWTLKSCFSVKVYLVFIWPFQGSDKEEEEENNEPYYDAIPDVPIETKKVPTLLRKRQQSPSKQVKIVNLST